MERRHFLLGLCGIGGAALTARAAVPATPRRARIINRTDRSIFLKIVSPYPGFDSAPPRGGMLFPEEEYLDDLGEGKRVLIAWDAMNDRILTMKEMAVLTPCRIDVYEGDAILTHEV
jgi:hypothetical protein